MLPNIRYFGRAPVTGKKSERGKKKLFFLPRAITFDFRWGRHWVVLKVVSRQPLADSAQEIMKTHTS